MLRRPLLCLGLAAALVAGAVALPTAAVVADDDDPITPGVIYAVGEKFDGSFNEGTYNALTAFSRDTGIAFLEVTPIDPGEFPQAVDRLTRRGVDTIIVVGFYYAEPLSVAAQNHPDIDFTIVDTVTEAPNVRSILFREHEGAFLTGMMAAMHSESGAVGFVGALDIPLIRKFVTGFEEGARYVDPDIDYFANFVGTTPAAFNDPSRASELAISQIDRGADVIFAGAGNSNRGVFQAAADRGAFAIGVDSNQNHEQPGTILTSMLKRVDNAVLESLYDSVDGVWEPGVLSLGIAEGGVGVALDDHNWPLITPEMMLAVQDAMVAIATGALEVTDASVE